MKPIVIYLIPAHGIGGVEQAAKSISGGNSVRNGLFLRTIANNEFKESIVREFSLLDYLSCLRTILSERPAVLIVSLWRAYLVGLIVKVLKPRTKLVIFLHFPRATHAFDFTLTLLSSILATEVWADSKETASRRVVLSLKKAPRVISFVTQKLEPKSALVMRPVFFFWGRLHSQKNLSRALTLYRRVIDMAALEWSHFYIIGPDCGDRKHIIHTIQNLGLVDRVTLVGPKSFSEIQELIPQGSFYLQTSKMEGMAMSVVEAMQLGLVPIVTPVGEIGNYARDGVNAIVINSDFEAVNSIVSLLWDEKRFLAVRKSAIETWRNAMLYQDDFFSGVRDVLNP